MSNSNEAVEVEQNLADVIQDPTQEDEPVVEQEDPISQLPLEDDRRTSILENPDLSAFGIKSVASRAAAAEDIDVLEANDTPIDEAADVEEADPISPNDEAEITSMDNDVDNDEADSTHPVKTDEDTPLQQEPSGHSIEDNGVLALDSVDEAQESEPEDDYSDEDEDEPKLKYQRLGASSQDLFSKDTASALAIHDRFLAVGTHNGAVHILDFEGNEIKHFNSHSATVHDLSIDKAGEYVGSASMDGKVVINGLYANDVFTFNYRRPVKCIALDPDFTRKNTKQFVSGGMAGQLVLNEKGWLGNKDTVLHSGEGSILGVKWQNNLIAWANERGVKIYDTTTNQRITYIDRPADSPRADLYRCNLCWKDETTLIIAWASSIKIAKVRERPRTDVLQGPASLYVEITSIFETDYIVAGISPLDDSLLVLAYLEALEDDNEAVQSSFKRKPARRPELRIIDSEAEEVSADALTMHGFELFQANDYCMGSISADLFYVLSPKDLVIARTRDLDDHVEWLLENGRYEHALDLVIKGKGLDRDRFNLKEVGKRYLETLMAKNDYALAAETCGRVFGDDASLWETWIFRFAEIGQMKTIAPHIPIRDPQLTGTIYELVLAFYLNTDRSALYKTIKSWPYIIYDKQSVISVVLDAHQADPADRTLMECLAELYAYDRQPSKALEFNLRLGRPEVFDLIRDFNLFDAVRDKVVLLLEFEHATIEQDVKDRDARKNADVPGIPKIRHASQGPAVQLLVEHTHSIPIPRVVEQLDEHPLFMYAYLDALFDKDPNAGFEFHDRQIDLYAEFDNPKLMDFLRASNNYSLEQALAVCTRRDLVPEMVYILGRMGDNKQALMLIIERLGDVERAIDFAKEQNDYDLWEDLLTYSMDKPDFIKGLLENVGTEIDPIRLIRRIPEGLAISDLRASVLKILNDYASQLLLGKNCYEILFKESMGNSTSLIKELKRGVSCDVVFGDPTSIDQCSVCQKEVFVDPDGVNDFVSIIYNCRHAVHRDCLNSKTVYGQCPVCLEQQQTIDAVR